MCRRQKKIKLFSPCNWKKRSSMFPRGKKDEHDDTWQSRSGTSYSLPWEADEEMSWYKAQLLLKAHGRHWCQCFGEHLCHGGNSRKTEVEPSPPKLCLLITDMGQALPKLLQPVFSPQGSSMWNPKCALVGSLSNLRCVSHLKNNPVHSVAGHCTSSRWLPFSQMNSRLIHRGREGNEHLLRTCTAFYIHRWFKPYPMGWDLFPQFADKENQPQWS